MKNAKVVIETDIYFSIIEKLPADPAEFSGWVLNMAGGKNKLTYKQNWHKSSEQFDKPLGSISLDLLYILLPKE